MPYLAAILYLSLTQPADYQQPPITADGYFFTKQQVTLVDEIW